MTLPDSRSIRSWKASDLADLERLDRAATGGERQALLRALCETGDCLVLDDDGVTTGFAIRRQSGHGHVIGPVVAPDDAGARALIARWMDESAGLFLRVDVPGNGDLADWLADRGLARTGAVVQMVRGNRTAVAGPTRIYALANQAVG